MKKESIWKIIIGGSGGQGIITFGKALAHAGICEKLNVSLLPTYGAEMRGGYVFCMLVFSTSKLSSPVISSADFGVFMDGYSFQLLQQKIKPSAWCLWNSSIITNPSTKKFLDIAIPASEIAEKNGDIQTANMVMFGALGKIMVDMGVLSTQKSLLLGLKQIISGKEKLKKNWSCIGEGWNLTGKVIKNRNKLYGTENK